MQPGCVVIYVRRGGGGGPGPLNVGSGDQAACIMLCLSPPNDFECMSSV